LRVDGAVPLGSTAAHEPTGIPKSLWARWKSLGAVNEYKQVRTSI
jgi:hypothetical protein